MGPDNFEVKGFSQLKHSHASMFATEPLRQPRVYEVNREPFVLIQSSSNGDADFSPQSQHAILSQYTELEPQNPASQVIRASVAQMPEQVILQPSMQIKTRGGEEGFEPLSNCKNFQQRRAHLISAGNFRNSKNYKSRQVNAAASSFVKAETIDTGETSLKQQKLIRVQTAMIGHRKQHDSQYVHDHKFRARGKRVQSHRITS